ncbi:phage holin family protein [Candidatus Saccharibacteria bacterium CPR2]|nr:phage holin family protein [Candidatus Saccharibacteria bacterium CPR2]
MRWQLIRFGLRWGANSLGLWIAAQLFDSVEYNNRLRTIFFAGLVLSLVNVIIKPIVVILSLPAIVFTLGIFIVFVNGLMVYLASLLVPAFEVDSYGTAIVAGMIIGLVNYSLTAFWDRKQLHDG